MLNPVTLLLKYEIKRAFMMRIRPANPPPRKNLRNLGAVRYTSAFPDKEIPRMVNGF